ncbi:hypothetical protein K9O30_14980 [Clostridium bowmanii]|uniref:hypothetical protein n=1 Tax=Clostridium bowmanii TaxID=132925 RepID=UPI001C0AEF34|nr:hypothetical protein [Clostridium bowmanii]MBU3190753.1 hypothetical protein [Clostridium bowmanii]MCA1075001.1 hypothetical protein [Clostridium bowmanii]
MNYVKNINDMRKHLGSQIFFLKNSISSYDSGFEDEGQRIATTIRILLHDTDNSTSLFKHLDMKTHMLFLSTALPYIPANMLSYEGLLATSTIGIYIPHCLSDNKIQGLCLVFEDWWNEIILDDKINVFSRKDIALYVANKDGGAHIDKNLNEAYTNLTKNNSLSGYLLVNNEKKPLYNSPVYACIRQIAFELLYSIDYSKNVKSFTRRKDNNDKFIATYVKEKIYFKPDKSLNNLFYEDCRISKSEERKNYIDKVIFISGKISERYVILK